MSGHRVDEQWIYARRRSLGPLDGEQRPGAIAIALVQMGAPQTRGVSGDDQRSGHAIRTPCGNVQMRSIVRATVEQARHAWMVGIG